MKQVISHYQAVLLPSVDLAKPYKQIPGHYQAVQRTVFNPFSINDSVDVESLMGFLYDVHTEPDAWAEEAEYFTENMRFFVPDFDEYNEDPESCIIGRIKLSREASLFPTMHANGLGAVISICGREYAVCYNAEGEFTIGHRDVLYCFSNSSCWADDVNEFYWFVVENTIPNTSTPGGQ